MIRENGFFYTDVRATESEEQSMREAYNVPLIVVGDLLPVPPGEVIHAYALEHGLPDIVGHYGYDFEEHLFIRMPDADQGEPDKWPSHRLSDVLRAARGAP